MWGHAGLNVYITYSTPHSVKPAQNDRGRKWQGDCNLSKGKGREGVREEERGKEGGRLGRTYPEKDKQRARYLAVS